MATVSSGTPDVLGMHLENAERLLSEAGVAFRVAETKPPFKKAMEGRLRVIRVRLDDALGGLELTVCRI
ncbi:MAG: hypothetical protein LBT26_12130 [Clostridiales Family XIII bacterium]|jgi:hypothetical protein|nr:hypothetical protein [Clostridiales Family XIII bacterium]